MHLKKKGKLTLKENNMRTNKKTIAVIGAGTMGSGIAQVAAQNNHSVVLVDTNKKTLENSRTKLQKILKRIVEKGKISQQKSTEIINNINYTDNLNSISSANLVIEAIIEDLDIKKVAQSIADGKIVGWFQGRSESGNRALGNRSILADPRNPDIKDIINKTIKKREDFRPFAPSVLEEHYQKYFDTTQPSPFMSRIVKLKGNGNV